MMLPCSICSHVINEDGQYYLFSDMGPDIISIVENYLGHDVDVNGTLCANCFSKIMKKMSTHASSESENSELLISTVQVNIEQDALNTRVCVWCKDALFNKNAHAVSEGHVKRFISEKIAIKDIPDDSLVCYKCWVQVRNILQQQKIEEERVTSGMNLNTCVWCLCSLNQKQSHSLPEGPERNVIFIRIYPRQIPSGGLVCHTCWVSACRIVQKSGKIDEKNKDPLCLHYHRYDVCMSCGISLFRRNIHYLPRRPKEDEVAAGIYPRELYEYILLCTTCSKQTVENNEVGQGNVKEQPRTNLMEIDDFTHTTNSSGHCFVPHCTGRERLRVPKHLRKKILTTQKVFVTEHARICKTHRTLNNWEFLDKREFSSTFTKLEMESMLALSRLN